MASSVGTELMNVSFCQLANTAVFICRNPLENVTYEFILTLMVCKMGGKWPYSWCLIEGCFQDLFKRACSIVVWFLSSFFSRCFIRVQLVTKSSKEFVFIFLERSNFHMVIKLLIEVQALSMCLLTSLSVDEILLLKFVNWSIDFRGLLFNEKMTLSWLKHINSVFIWVHIESNAFCCLLQVMQQRFDLSWWICKKC